MLEFEKKYKNTFPLKYRIKHIFNSLYNIKSRKRADNLTQKSAILHDDEKEMHET